MTSLDNVLGRHRKDFTRAGFGMWRTRRASAKEDRWSHIALRTPIRRTACDSVQRVAEKMGSPGIWSAVCMRDSDSRFMPWLTAFGGRGEYPVFAWHTR